MDSISIVRQIVLRDKCDIFLIEYGPNSIQCCLKIIKCDGLSLINKYLKEVVNLSLAREDNLTIKLIDYEIKQINERFTLRIVTEYCERGNLLQWLQRKQLHQEYFSDEELIKICREFIKCFSNLQKINISHRDIKPENIFVTTDYKLKIGDFGSSVLIEDQENFTITGSPLYLSPELRDGHERWIQRLGGRRIVHCPFKSDVFSLGLVFLYMATLLKIDSFQIKKSI